MSATILSLSKALRRAPFPVTIRAVMHVYACIAASENKGYHKSSIKSPPGGVVVVGGGGLIYFQASRYGST